MSSCATPSQSFSRTSLSFHGISLRYRNNEATDVEPVNKSSVHQGSVLAGRPGTERVILVRENQSASRKSEGLFLTLVIRSK